MRLLLNDLFIDSQNFDRNNFLLYNIEYLHLLFITFIIHIYSQYYFTNKILKLRERRVISLNNQIFLIKVYHLSNN